VAMLTKAFSAAPHTYTQNKTTLQRPCTDSTRKKCRYAVYVLKKNVTTLSERERSSLFVAVV